MLYSVKPSDLCWLIDHYPHVLFMNKSEVYCQTCVITLFPLLSTASIMARLGNAIFGTPNYI